MLDRPARPLMKCGCVSNSVCAGRDGKTFDPPIPSCVVHDCLEVADSTPDLTGRTAQCSYLPKNHAPRPSSLDLAFFKFRGENSPDANTTCKQCKKSIVLHWPQWTAQIKVVRRWYKIDRYEDTITRSYGCPDEATAKMRAESEADFFRKMTGKHHKDTEVFEATVTALTQGKPRENHPFTAHGAFECDDYYCGCHGWD